MPPVRVGRHAAGRSAEHTQNRRLIGLGRLRQQIKVTLNEARDRRAPPGGRVTLSAPNHLFVHAFSDWLGLRSDRVSL